MEDRKQFTFYGSFWDAIRELPAKYQLPALRAIICYALFQEEPTSLPPTCRAVFLLVKPTLDASRKKAANGKLGGQSGKQTGSKPEANPKQSPREKEKEKEKEREIEIEDENDKRSTPKAPLSGELSAQPTEGSSPVGAADGRPQRLPFQGSCREATEGSHSRPLDGRSFTAFWEAYPRKIARDAAWEAWKTLSPSPDTAIQIMTALDRWKQFDQWQEENGRYIPRAAKFLAERYWESPPGSPEPSTRQFDPDEAAAIRRMLEDDPPIAPNPSIAETAPEGRKENGEASHDQEVSP